MKRITNPRFQLVSGIVDRERHDGLDHMNGKKKGLLTNCTHSEANFTVRSAWGISKYLSYMLTRANGEICFIVKMTNEGQRKMSSSLEIYFLFVDGADEHDK